MLGRRVLSALVLAPAVWALVWAGGWPLELVVGALVAQMVREMLPMVGVGRTTPLGLAAVAATLLSYLGVLGHLPSGLGAGGWPAALAILPLAAALAEPGALAATMGRAAQTALAAAYCGSLLPHLVLLRRREGGVGLALMVLGAVWAADTGAYFVGRMCGRRPLAPRISPNKTLEGAWGGLAAAVAAALAVSSIWPVRQSVGQVATIGAIGAVVGTIGDLCESALKRAAGVKDSAGLIPGHGGVLDRFDALMFAAPAATAYLALVA